MVDIFVAFSLFAVGWLHFDAWLVRKRLLEIVKPLGFMLLSFSFLLSSLILQSPYTFQHAISPDFLEYSSLYLRLAGYFVLAVSLLREPLQKKPFAHAWFGTGFGSSSFFQYFQPLSAFFIAGLYMRKVTIGLEKHLGLMIWVFIFLGFAETAGLLQRILHIDSITEEYILGQFGALWLVEQVCLLLVIGITGKWVFGYLLKRVQSQLFLFGCVGVIVTLLLTMFTSMIILFTKMQSEAIRHLTTDLRVFEYALATKQEELLSSAELIARQQTVIDALLAKDRKQLSVIALSGILSKKLSTLALLSPEGEVLMRGEDTERVGESLSSDPMIKRVLNSRASLVTFSRKDGVLSPEIHVNAVVPIVSESKIVGVVLAGNKLDNAFLDGIKQRTDLEVSLYAGNVRAATTFISPDHKTRLVGVRESSNEVISTVLKKHTIFTGERTILQVPYLTVYSPLADKDGVILGMFFIGKEQIVLYRAVLQALEIAFYAVVILIIVLLVPTYIVSRYIGSQFE